MHIKELLENHECGEQSCQHVKQLKMADGKLKKKEEEIRQLKDELRDQKNINIQQRNRVEQLEKEVDCLRRENEKLSAAIEALVEENKMFATNLKKVVKDVEDLKQRNRNM